MRRWYVPTTNGDFRVEAAGEGKSVLIVERPTKTEVDVLSKLWPTFVKKGWTNAVVPTGLRGGWVEMDAPVHLVGKQLGKAMKTGRRSVEVYRFSNGRVTVEEMWETILPEGVEVAATTSVPKTGCPACEHDGDRAERASMVVLREFLSPSQVAELNYRGWFSAIGNVTGTRYGIFNRFSREAARFGRALADLDAGLAVCAFDPDVPPGEEMLGLKILVEHLERKIRPA